MISDITHTYTHTMALCLKGRIIYDGKFDMWELLTNAVIFHDAIMSAL